jgi:DUF971 family protein
VKKILRLTIKGSTALLSITYDDNAVAELSFEYLRVFAPTDAKGQPTGATPAVFHKKQVQLTTIELAGKHGYRFIFDDGYSGIYAPEYLSMLDTQHTERWQHYLLSIDSVANSREATIEIKEVK